MSDDTLTDEDRTAIGRAWRELVEEKAHGGKLHYSMPKVRGMAPSGSFRIRKDVFAALGQGDLKVGGAEDTPDDPTIIHPHVVRIIGHGNLATGRRVLEKFVARVRHGARDGVILEHDGLQHDDSGHGWSVRR